MRSGWLIAGALALGLLLAGRGAAQEHGGEKAADAKASQHGAAKDGEHGGGGQKNPFKPSYNPLDLTLWSIVVFLLLLVTLGKFAWKPMLAGLQQREKTISEALMQAERTRREALEQQAKMQAEMTAASQKVAAQIEQAHRDAAALKEQFMTDAKAEAQRERDRLHREIETAKDQALKDIWEQSVSVAALMSSKVIKRQLTAEDHRRLLDDTLVEIKAFGTSRKNA